eukprot:353381-Chlamydomonas_euryale.AAC.2
METRRETSRQAHMRVGRQAGRHMCTHAAIVCCMPNSVALAAVLAYCRGMHLPRTAHLANALHTYGNTYK